jgi:hypothetical protein
MFTLAHLSSAMSLDRMDGESRPVHFLRNSDEESCGGDSIILLLIETRPGILVRVVIGNQSS